MSQDTTRDDQTTQETELEDLPVEEESTELVKGGPGFIILGRAG